MGKTSVEVRIDTIKSIVEAFGEVIQKIHPNNNDGNKIHVWSFNPLKDMYVLRTYENGMQTSKCNRKDFYKSGMMHYKRLKK